MEQRDALAEARAEAADGLRRERDLRHEHDRAEPALERGRARLEVDLGLAAARRAVEEEVGSGAVVESARDPLAGALLRVGETRGLRLSGERLAHARLRTLAARLSLHRRDERERARRRRAVVVRDPERELDERFGQLLDDAFDGATSTPGGAFTPSSTTSPRRFALPKRPRRPSRRGRPPAPRT